MVKNFPFLRSTRFWAVVIFALAIWLGDAGVMPAELVAFLQTVTGGHVGLRTIDRFGETVGKKK